MNAIATAKYEGMGNQTAPGNADCAQTESAPRSDVAQRLQYHLRDDLVRSWLVDMKRERAVQSRMKWVLLGLVLALLAGLAVGVYT